MSNEIVVSQPLMARQGIERRVVTAGKSKSFADPFLPQKPEDVERLKRLQDPIHAAFIEHVKARRGARAWVVMRTGWESLAAPAIGRRTPWIRK